MRDSISCRFPASRSLLAALGLLSALAGWPAAAASPDGAPRGAEDRAGATRAGCPPCTEAVAASLAFWKSLFDNVLRDHPMDPGLYANLSGVAKRNPDFRSFLEEQLTEANLPRGNWARLVRRSHAELPDLELYREPWMRAFTKTLYCDLDRGYGPSDFRDLLAMADLEGGYFDTHLLMGLLLLKENSCRDPGEIDRLVADVAKRLLAAQRETPVFSDLFVERVVFLYWAGFGDRIEEDWIRTILDHQNPDHGWGNTPGRPSNPHTASLAMLALTYYASGRRIQEFFYPALPDAEPPSP